MDWTELSNRLAEGVKVYKMFQDGAEVASMLGSLERAKSELQAQYDALIPQIEQAKATIVDVAIQAEKARTDSIARAVAQQKDLDTAHRRQVTEAQADLDVWVAKVSAQATAHENQRNAYHAQISQLQATVDQLTDQVATLQDMKASLKSQLGSVV